MFKNIVDPFHHRGYLVACGTKCPQSKIEKTIETWNLYLCLKYWSKTNAIEQVGGGV